MRKTNETDSLNELIIQQQKKHDVELVLLKDQFDVAYESIKPINLIKSLIHEVTTTPEIKNDISTDILALVSGFLSKKLLVNDSSSPVKQVLGTILQFAMTNVVAKHSDTIKNFGSNIWNRILHKNNS
jgi:hypothetical protein